MDCLPFDIPIKIAKYFNLRDSYSFSKSFVRAHDAVYFVYSHRQVLDFLSVLTVDKVIGISDEEILQLLHAHTRVVCITNLALPPSFSMFPDLEAYMRTYLCPAFEGAHARGQLCQIQFSKLCGARGTIETNVVDC